MLLIVLSANDRKTIMPYDAIFTGQVYDKLVLAEEHFRPRTYRWYFLKF